MVLGDGMGDHNTMETALELSQYGWRVHPVAGVIMKTRPPASDGSPVSPEGMCLCGRGPACRHPGKHPLLKGWVEKASSDPEVISLWDWEDKNIGVVPGGDMTILDFDGAEGLAVLEKLGDIMPPLPDGTPICRTGSGGVHIYLNTAAPTRTRLLPGLDIRGKGGQAVVPPSLHYSGNRYIWVVPPSGPLPEAPSEWVALAQGVVSTQLKPFEVISLDRLRDLARRRGKLQGVLQAIVAGTSFATDGERNDTLAKVCGYLAREFPFADPERIADLLHPSISAMATEEPDGALTRDDVLSHFSRFSEKERNRNNEDDRPRILITTHIVEMAQEAIVILSARDKGLYVRSGQLVKVKVDSTLPGLTSRPEAPPTITSLPESVLTGMLTEEMQWYKVLKDGEVRNCLPIVPVVKYLMDIGVWQELPPLENVVQGPVLRQDGTIFPGGGYDELTGIYSVGSVEEIPELSVQECIIGLKESVIDFPFETDTDRAAWMAGVLTAVGRDAIPGPTPMFLIDANVRGAGKTLLAHTAAMIANSSGATSATLGRDEEEDRKVITSLAKDGARNILIDNVTGTFGTAKLCEVLSLHSGVWSDRLLGSNRTWRGPFAPTWWATANNVNLAADVARRTCYIRLSSDWERPEEREDFHHPSLLAWVAENRRYLFHCALVLLKEYCAAGRPGSDTLAAWGGYEVWSSLVRGTLVWAGEPDPANNKEQLAYSDTDHDYGEMLVEGLDELFAEHGPMTVQEIVDALYSPGKTLTEMKRYSTLREVIEADTSGRNSSGKPTAKSVGWMFRRYRGRVFGRKHIERARKKWRIVDNVGV